MYCIITSIPLYDDRDGLCGVERRIEPGYRYETLELASAMACRLRGEDDEIAIHVADTSDPRLQPVYRERTAQDMLDDGIPF